MSTSSSKSVDRILGDDGIIAGKLANYESRPQQLDMARAVADVFANGGRLLVEAGTGVGKSFAYLVPAIDHVLQHGGRVVISTHTIALQEQLIHKDIPFLRSVFPDEFSAELVKGRANYLGLRRLSRASARQGVLFDADDQLSELHRIEDWAYETVDGTLSDIPVQPSFSVWDRVRSDGDDCMGRKCPQYQACYFQKARRRAQIAQLLIVNHALLFSDLAVRKQGGSMLPEYDLLVLDEAHTVEGVAGDHLGVQVANAQVRYILNTLYNERTGRGTLASLPASDIIPTVHHTRQAAEAYFNEFAVLRSQNRSWNGRLREPPGVDERVSSGLIELHQMLRELHNEIEDEQDRSEVHGYAERCKMLASSITGWHQQSEPNWVYWIESEAGPRQRVTIAARPIEVGPVLKAMLFDTLRTVVMTSATLSTGGSDPFQYVRERVGAEESITLQLGSPFNYRDQMVAYVEADMPDPSAPEFLDAACTAIRKYLEKTEGHAFVLFTSYDMLRKSSDALAGFLNRNEMPLYVKGGALPRSQMLERFRSTPRSVLFGTDSFWAGVDVPGDALTNVIIVKLPFASPTQPAIEARIDHLREKGGNPFMDFQLPEAILKFRQGIGRLIRTKTDRGIIAILDPRVVTKRYGQLFLDALPPCEVVIERG